MIPEYNFTEFKRHLCSKPKWIRRGLFVIAHSPDIATPKNIDTILQHIKAIDRYGNFGGRTGRPITETSASKIVRVHAYDIYKFYRNRKRFVEIVEVKTTS